jgi:hypothetical protein
MTPPELHQAQMNSILEIYDFWQNNPLSVINLMTEAKWHPEWYPEWYRNDTRNDTRNYTTIRSVCKFDSPLPAFLLVTGTSFHKEPREVYNVAITSTAEDTRPSITRVYPKYNLNIT